MRKTWSLIRKNPWVLLLALLLGYYLYTQLFNALAKRHFDAHCENDAGEFIYKTVDNVEGLFQMRLRDPEDYFENIRHYLRGKGELLEDPFGHTNAEAQEPHGLFLGIPNKDYYKYDFFETTKAPARTSLDDELIWPTTFASPPVVTGDQYWIYTLDRVDRDGRSIGEIYSAKQSQKLKSRYGFTWQEIRTQWDEIFDIWGGS